MNGNSEQLYVFKTQTYVSNIFCYVLSIVKNSKILELFIIFTKKYTNEKQK